MGRMPVRASCLMFLFSIIDFLQSRIKRNKENVLITTENIFIKFNLRCHLLE